MRRLSTSAQRVAVAVSGGVDSSVTALKLKEQGRAAFAIFMRNWDKQDESGGACNQDKDFEDASRVCTQIGLPLHEVSFQKEYWNNVFADFLDGYQAGVTPNPDVACNRLIKFDLLLKHVQALGASTLATGHYARTDRGGLNGAPRLLRGVDDSKDQSLFLCMIKREVLNHIEFPIGAMLKSEVRESARKTGLVTAEKKDSTGLCFVGKRHFPTFMSHYVPENPGYFVDAETGSLLSRHQGMHLYTVGQRARIGGLAAPLYISKIDPRRNQVHVATKDHPSMFTTSVLLLAPNWLTDEPPLDRPLSCRTRHLGVEQSCVLRPADPNVSAVELCFDQPAWGVAPGQVAVVYDGDVCLGGGVMTSMPPPS